MFSIRALLTEAASTSSAATHWSPAVQNWSLCVFWCTGPECDVISLLRQKRQARSPPSGHRPLTWTGALYAIITELLRQTSSVAYGKSRSSRKKVWNQELGRKHTSVEEAWKAWAGKTEDKYRTKDLSSAMDPDDNELGIFTVIQWVVVCCGSVFCAYFPIQSDLIIHNCHASYNNQHIDDGNCKEFWLFRLYTLLRWFSFLL